MRVSIVLLLVLYTASHTFAASASLRSNRFDLLTEAVARMLKLPKFRDKMFWERGGVSIDVFSDYLGVHAPEIYRSYSERGLHTQLGKILVEELEEDIFVLRIGEDGKTVRKYFWGKEPDIKKVVIDVITRPEVMTKLAWRNGGLTINDILLEIINYHQDVYNLYVQASYNFNDRGFRTVLVKAMNEQLNRHFFTIRVETKDKPIRKYFWGKKPDLKEIFYEVIADSELSKRMTATSSGATMDEIAAIVAQRYPEISFLYSQASTASTNRGFRTALGIMLVQTGAVVSRVIDRQKRYFWKQ